MRKAAILDTQKDLTDKICRVEKFSSHPLASLDSVNQVIASRPTPPVLIPTTDLIN